jgi:hypothetical protein
MKYKLLFENWKMFVEKENKQKKDGGMAKSVYKKLSPEKKVLQDLVDEEYSDFVADLQKHIRDEKFQAFLQMGLEQFDGDAEDDKVKVKSDNIPVKNLVPTQSQIGLADSLGYLSSNDPAGAGKIAKLKGTPANVGGRIVVANGRYIIDGHHRWSQVYLLNPDAKIPTYNFSTSDLPDKDPAKGALKLAHLAIAAVDQAVPLQNADAATDVYATAGDTQQIRNILDDVISDDMAKNLMDAYRVESKDEVLDIVTKNAVALYKETREFAEKGPIRGLMPQTTQMSPVMNKLSQLKLGSTNWSAKDDSKRKARRTKKKKQ